MCNKQNVCKIFLFPLDVDECSTGNNSCHVNASCTNTDGSYECDCISGFSGDGYNCSSKFCAIEIICKNYQSLLIYITDIDECADSLLNNCSVYANCTDTIGSYDCTCLVGFTGDGFSCDGKSNQ